MHGQDEIVGPIPFFFFFLNQFVFRNTSLRLGPVCIYEPIQFKRDGNSEVPTRRVSEAETNRVWRRVNVKRGAPVGRPETTRRSSGSTTYRAAIKAQLV
jgi:NAD-dependent oxidoreductase involved in siderophore biosynthesis